MDLVNDDGRSLAGELEFLRTSDTPHTAHLALDGAERKLHARILPFMFAIVTLSFIDRTNLAFAALEMNEDLGISSTAYGWGSGVFFLGYSAVQMPSNLLLLHFGAPFWLMVITMLWGICASSFALVRHAWQFLLLRFLLGLFEGGAIPGIWYHLSLFYPPHRLTLPYSVVETGITVSQIMGAPLAAALLQLDGTCGLRGWQWVFLAEGLPSILLAALLYLCLPEGLQVATFLTLEERAALAKEMKHHSSRSRGSSSTCTHESRSPREDPADVDGDEHSTLLGASAARAAETATSAASASAPAAQRGQAASTGAQRSSSPSWLVLLQQIRAVARDPVVLYAGGWRVLHDIAGYGVLFWTPMLVHALLAGSAGSSKEAKHDFSCKPMHGSTTSQLSEVVMLTAIPFACASVFHLLNARHSQQTDERRLHIVVPWAAAAACLLLLPAAVSMQRMGAGFLLLVLVHMGVNGANGCQTSWVASLLQGPNRAVGLAMYNSIGGLGGCLGPVILGTLCDVLGNYNASMMAMGASLAGAVVMVFEFRPQGMRQRSARQVA